MEIFGIGPMELLLVFILALIFIGPGKMPEVAASLGKMLREFRAASAELTEALNAEIADVERRKNLTAATAGENGHSQELIGAAETEIVAQGDVEAPSAVEYTPVEIPTYQYESSSPAPAPVPTIEDVLAAIAQQDLDAAAMREAEEAARIAAERAIRDGVAPLPEALLLPSTDAPLAVVNPTEQLTSDPVVASVDIEQVESTEDVPSTDLEDESNAVLQPAADAQANGTLDTADHEPIEANATSQAEVL